MQGMKDSLNPLFLVYWKIFSAESS